MIQFSSGTLVLKIERKKKLLLQKFANSRDQIFQMMWCSGLISRQKGEDILDVDVMETLEKVTKVAFSQERE